MGNPLTLVSRKFFESMAGRLSSGRLELVCPEGSREFGPADAPLRATLAVHDERFFRRAVFGGDTGIGESYMEGEWSSPDLVAVIRLAVRNLSVMEDSHPALSLLNRVLDNLAHRRRDNSIEGSRRNIRAHYDLNTEFFRLFLDRNLVYSSAVYERDDQALEDAQRNKLDRICRKLRLGPRDHILEIGTGWGAFALHAARNYGCRVTTTTISREQYLHSKELSGREGDGRIEVVLRDYRELTGKYDHIVSIEMFEAVGHEHYDDFFGICDRLLKPQGTMLLQTITINEQRFQAYRRRADWIQKYIFPGAELASVSEILRSLARCTRMSLFHLEEIGAHYARTLEEWRRRFLAQIPAVKQLGFDDRFIRMWEFYLAYCEGAFRERHIGDVQLLLTRNYNPRPLLGEPWQQEETAAAAIVREESRAVAGEAEMRRASQVKASSD